jgi:hypothetical protein
MKKVLIFFVLPIAMIFAGGIKKNKDNNFIIMNLMGRLGNQLFQIAAGLSLAKDNNAILLVPDLVLKSNQNIFPYNRYSFA